MVTSRYSNLFSSKLPNYERFTGHTLCIIPINDEVHKDPIQVCTVYFSFGQIRESSNVIIMSISSSSIIISLITA